ncbi:MAG: hypothetical protein ACYSO7_13360 [Planctomycetota bacterium]|jgi:hypothetical protein
MKKIKEHISERTFIISPKKQMVIKFLPVSISAETLLPPVIPSEQRNDFAGTVGMDFYITDTGSRVVDSLGFYDDGQEGLQAAHRVAVWNDTTGLKIAEVTVPSGTGICIRDLGTHRSPLGPLHSMQTPPIPLALRHSSESIPGPIFQGNHLIPIMSEVMGGGVDMPMIIPSPF